MFLEDVFIVMFCNCLVVLIEDLGLKVVEARREEGDWIGL